MGFTQWFYRYWVVRILYDRNECISCSFVYLATPAPVKTTPDKTDDIEEETRDDTEIIDNELSDSEHDTEDEIRLEFYKIFSR